VNRAITYTFGISFPSTQELPDEAVLVICTTWPNYDHHSQRGKLKVPNGFEE
jgi:hypothetical protein